jgi:hypothetical protein
LDIVSTLVPLAAVEQLIQVLPMPAVSKMLLDLLKVLPSGEPVGWSVPEISLSQTR